MMMIDDDDDDDDAGGGGGGGGGDNDDDDKDDDDDDDHDDDDECCCSNCKKTFWGMLSQQPKTHMHAISMRFDKECCRRNFKKKLRHAVTAPSQTHTHSFNASRKAMLSQHHWKNNSNCKKTFGGMLSQQPKTHTCTQPQCVLTKNAVAATLKKNDWGMLSQHPHKHAHTHSFNAFRKAMLSQHHAKKQQQL